MLINASNIQNLFFGFSAAFQQGWDGATSQYSRFCLDVPSQTSENEYAWLGQFPGMREWLGDRLIKNLRAHSYTIKNKNFESTVSVNRNNIEDDRYGVYGPIFRALGEEAATHPDKLVYGLMSEGTVQTCYDGKPFFSTEHPVIVDNKAQKVSNLLQPESSEGPAWYLLCTPRAMRPFIFQKRREYKLVALDKENDENVFFRNEYLYGIDARVNAGYGLWQLAVCSTFGLDADSYAAARSTMASYIADNGKKLGIVPDLLVVPSELEKDARLLLNCEQINSSSNPWHGSAELLVSPWL